MISALRVTLKTMCVCWTLIGALLCHVPAMATAQRAPDHLKAAYLFNFAKLIDWPSDMLPQPDSPLVFCTSSGDGLTQELRHLASNPLGQRRVQVVALGARSDADFCHLVFIGREYTRTWFRHHKTETPGQLVIGEHPDLIALGGVINFYVERERLRFEISLANAQTAGLRISSRLLKLARIVDPLQEEGPNGD